MIQTDVAVIGGGAAGLVAAISAARHGAKTVIIEHMDRVGKKILATGNGKCNYTNAVQGISCYRGENPAFVLSVLEQFGFKQTIAFFQELGIYPKDRNGYYYPSSEQAASVLDVLRMECGYQKVTTMTSCNITHIKKAKKGFLIETNMGIVSAGKIIVATGLLASPKTGSDGSAFPFIEKLGHHFIKIVPALVQLQGKQSFFKSLAGIRTEVSIDLYINQKDTKKVIPVCSEYGELQLTEYGISGIPVFQISRYATRALSEKRQVCAVINFAPKLAKTDLLQLLEQRFGIHAHNKTASETLIGLFNKKLNDVLLKESGISLSVPAEQVTKTQMEKLCRTIQKFRVDIIGSKDFSSAQACAGGVDTRELDDKTMESKLIPGLYFAGEVIDIDGACGGYNLQWAWSSGYVAGMYAAKNR